MGRYLLADHLKTPATERVASSIKRLTELSSELRTETNEVGKSLAQFEKPLLKLAVVPTWHKIAGHEDQHGNHWSREVGYTTVNGVWCIALRRTWGNEFADDFHEEVWRFNEAPHWQQIEALGKLPGLYEELITRTEETIKKLRAKR